LETTLVQMPRPVQRFMLHLPRDPPLWRYREKASEREQREFMQDQGA